MKFHYRDHLSVRVTSDSAGGNRTEQAHYPFGEQWYSQDGSGASVAPGKLLFTSYERDAESGNDYAIFRTHISRLGRFNRPDPLAGDVYNPQRLNRFAYSLNDPVNLIDPQGLDVFDFFDNTYPLLHDGSLGGPGGGGTACYIHGMRTTCTLALSLVASGAGEIGPMEEIRWNPNKGKYEQYRCTALGCGWGDLHQSATASSGQSGQQTTPTDKNGVPCDQKIEQAVNNTFGTNATVEGLGVDRGGTWNVQLTATNLNPQQMQAMSGGRHGGNLLGVGSTVEINNSTPTSANSLTFTAHLDSANPSRFPWITGAVVHFFMDVLTNAGGPCP